MTAHAECLADDRVRRSEPSVARREAELQAMREGAARRLAALGEMTAGIIHDFGNCLAVIEAGLSLAEASDDQQKTRAYLTATREAAGRGMKLTKALLNFAKQRETSPSASDVNELLGNLELFLGYGAGPRIKVDFDLAPDVPKCLVDPTQFNAAIFNLVVNARDAMPNGGAVTIGTSRRRAADVEPSASTEFVQVRVSDNGPGMPAEVAKKIFEPFFTTKGAKGAGLGLPQVAALMRAVGGHVRVSSERGRGSTFDLFFPALTESAAALPPELLKSIAPSETDAAWAEPEQAR